MSFLSGILNLFSDLLLGPVIAGEILLLIWSLVLAGDCHAEWLRRLRSGGKYRSLTQRILIGEIKAVEELKLPGGRRRVSDSLAQAEKAGWREVHLRKILSDLELGARKSLEAPTSLIRMGPMFGLMGTLIPMGPALKGLAGGDLETMAANLQVAFSTTVVGVFIGGIGFLCRQARQRWAQEDISLADWIFSLACRINQNGDKTE